MNFFMVVDTTQSGTIEYLYINGSKLDLVGVQNCIKYLHKMQNSYSSVRTINALTGPGSYQIFDYFFVDGQALTPDVFGF